MITVLNENYTIIPSGTITLNADSLSIQSFIMQRGEVSNAEYLLFLKDLIATGRIKEYEIAKIDSTGWNDKNTANSNFTVHYHTHSAYLDYPVVNVSKAGAIMYCEWLSKKVNEQLGKENGLIFRIPAHAEWVYAANAGNKNATYSWGSPYLRNEKGQFLANFLKLDETSISRDSLTNEFKIKPLHSLNQGNVFNDFSDVIAPTKSYFSSPFQLYNMNGNVAEMVADYGFAVGGSWMEPGYDVRNLSVKKFTNASIAIGFRVVATVNSKDHSWLKNMK